MYPIFFQKVQPLPRQTKLEPGRKTSFRLFTLMLKKPCSLSSTKQKVCRSRSWEQSYTSIHCTSQWQDRLSLSLEEKHLSGCLRWCWRSVVLLVEASKKFVKLYIVHHNVHVFNIRSCDIIIGIPVKKNHTQGSLRVCFKEIQLYIALDTICHEQLTDYPIVCG